MLRWRRPTERLVPVVTAPDAPSPAPRAELTFRDGSRAVLDPQQSRALGELAQILTQRDEVKP